MKKTCNTCGNKDEDGNCAIADPIIICLGWDDDYRYWRPIIDFPEFIEQEEMTL